MTFIFEVFNKSIALAVYKLQLGFGGGGLLEGFKINWTIN